MSPTPEEIKLFCDAFDALAQFEAEHRMIRRYGCFTEESVKEVQPTCMKVLEWLRSHNSNRT